MTKDELITAVPVYEHSGKPYFIRLNDIPEPWRAQFKQALYGAQRPMLEGEGPLAYAWDWQSWVNSSWYGGQIIPFGLEDD